MAKKRTLLEQREFENRLKKRMGEENSLFNPGSKKGRALQNTVSIMNGINLKSEELQGKLAEAREAMDSLQRNNLFEDEGIDAVNTLQSFGDLLASPHSDRETVYDAIMEKAKRYGPEYEQKVRSTLQEISIALEVGYDPETLTMRDHIKGTQVIDNADLVALRKKRHQQQKEFREARKNEAQNHPQPNEGEAVEAVEAVDAEKSTASAWIKQFQSNAPAPNVITDDKTEWIEDIIAVRSLAESVRHDKTRLKERSFSIQEINQRKKELQANKGYKTFIRSLTSGPDSVTRYEAAYKAGTTKHGGGLDDQLSHSLVMGGQLTNHGNEPSVMDRYVPTANENIERFQKHLKDAKEGKIQMSSKEAATCMAHIMCSRMSVGAEKATGLFKTTDARLDDKLSNFEKYNQDVKTVSEKMEKELLSNSKDSQKWMDLAIHGHGGSLLNEYNSKLRTQEANLAKEDMKEIQQGSALMNEI